MLCSPYSRTHQAFCVGRLAGSWASTAVEHCRAPRQNLGPGSLALTDSEHDKGATPSTGDGG